MAGSAAKGVRDGKWLDCLLRCWRELVQFIAAIELNGRIMPLLAQPFDLDQRRAGAMAFWLHQLLIAG